MLILTVPSWAHRIRADFFVPYKSSLQPEAHHPARGIAGSGLRPLSKIPHCCLPKESGPCLSSSVAGRPLRPATDRWLGRLLTYQLPNLISAAPIARGSCESPAFIQRSYAVLAQLSLRYPPRLGTFRYITHPFATLEGLLLLPFDLHV